MEERVSDAAISCGPQAHCVTVRDLIEFERSPYIAHFSQAQLSQTYPIVGKGEKTGYRLRRKDLELILESLLLYVSGCQAG